MKLPPRERRRPLSLETLELRVLLAADGDAWKAALGADSVGVKGHLAINGQDQVLILRGHGDHSSLILDTDLLGAQVEQIYIRAVDLVTLTGSRNLNVIELESVHRADLGEVTVNLGVYANNVNKLQVDSPRLFAVIDSMNPIIVRSNHFEDALVLTNAAQLRLSSPQPVNSLSLVNLSEANQVELDFSVGQLNLVGFTLPPQFVAPFPALASAPVASVPAASDAPAFPLPTAEVGAGALQFAAPGEIFVGLPMNVSARLPEKLAGLSSPVSLPRATRLANFIVQAIEVAQNPADITVAAVKAAPDLNAPVVPAAIKIVDDAYPEAKKPAAPPAGGTPRAQRPIGRRILGRFALFEPWTGKLPARFLRSPRFRSTGGLNCRAASGRPPRVQRRPPCG